MKPTFSLLALLLVFLSAACKKEEVDTLPKATQDGRGTMGCLVDGKAWTPYVSPRLGGGSLFIAYWRTGAGSHPSLTMFFNRDTQDDRPASSIYFFTPNVTGPNSVALDQLANPMLASANPAYANFTDSKTGLEVYHITGPTATGQLTLTRFDTVARIASGTFHFQGRATNGTLVSVTDGRFDVRLERR